MSFYQQYYQLPFINQNSHKEMLKKKRKLHIIWDKKKVFSHTRGKAQVKRLLLHLRDIQGWQKIFWGEEIFQFPETYVSMWGIISLVPMNSIVAQLDFHVSGGNMTGLFPSS